MCIKPIDPVKTPECKGFFSDQKHIDDLPNEIIYEIFTKLLGDQNNMVICKKICSRWEDIVHYLIQNQVYFYFENQRVERDKFFCFFKKNKKKVKSLKFSKCFFDTKFRKGKKRTVYDIHAEVDFFLEELIKNFPNLHFLEFSNCNFVIPECEEFLRERKPDLEVIIRSD